MAGNTPKAQQIGTELARTREAAGLSVRALADRLGYAGSTISRWENGERFPKPSYIAQYLAAVGAPAEQIGELVDLAQDPDDTLWLAVTLPDQRRQLAALLETERTATSITTVSPLLVPGMLQTSAYARAIMLNAEVPESEVNTRVSVRVGRRDAITRADAPASLTAFIWEPVLRQSIGNPQVMRDQLQTLLDCAELPNVTLRIIPAACPWNPALEGPWSIRYFADREATVHMENRVSGLFVQQPHEVQKYESAIATIEAVAMTTEQSCKVITDEIEGKETAS